MSPNNDLLQHATSTVDFYALLTLDPTATLSENDIRRAYRKTALKYHPDKLGDAFDPEKFHLIQIASDVLSDPAAKEAYDNARAARERKKVANEQFEGKRRAMKEELERAEKNAGQAFQAAAAGVKRSWSAAAGGGDTEKERLEAEIRRLEEDGRRRRLEKEEQLRKAAMAASTPSTPTTGTFSQNGARETPAQPPSSKSTANAAATSTTSEPTMTEEEEEEKIRELERRIAQATEAKAKRKAEKAEKRARKSGIFVPASPAESVRPVSRVGDVSTPAPAPPPAVSTPKQPPPQSRLNDLNGSKPSTPKFSFSPSTSTKTAGLGTPGDNFAATMARLKARQQLEDEIRRKESEAS